MDREFWNDLLGGLEEIPEYDLPEYELPEVEPLNLDADLEEELPF